MKVNAKSYPHPVLGNEDDLAGSFDVDFRYQLGRKEIALQPSFSIKSPAIDELIRKNKASYFIEVECRSTFFRTCFATQKPMERFSIPAARVRERVTVGFFVCADEDINGYRPSDCHPDYEGTAFDVEKGDVLAAGGFSSFIAEKDFDPLRPPVSSFMAIREGRHHEGPMEVDYDEEKITIELSKTDWREYAGIRNQKHAEGVLHAAIVLPVLVSAVQHVQSGNADYEGKNWFGRLQTILETKGLRERDPLEAAQKILDNPVTRALSGFTALLEPGSDHEDS